MRLPSSISVPRALHLVQQPQSRERQVLVDHVEHARLLRQQLAPIRRLR